MKRRMQQMTTINSTLIFKYTCTLCMCHEEIHVSPTVHVCTEIGHV